MQSAKDYAYKLLSYRQRSVRELAGRLQKKGFSPEIIRKTIAYLREIDYLNDEKFARFWIRSKIESSPVGRTLLRYQLKQKGIPQNIIEKVMADCAGSYSEYQAAKSLAESRTSRYQGIPAVQRKRRLYAYLRRRGFAQEAIIQAIDS